MVTFVSNILLIVFIAAMLLWGMWRFNQKKKQGQDTLEQGLAFLANNMKDDGVLSTESGLQYKILTKGEGGASPSATDKVKVHYHGTLTDGTVFDSSVKRGQPISFALNQVITGWTEGLQLMSTADKYRLFIPASLAYGGQSMGGIPANSTLIFDVELLDIES